MAVTDADADPHRRASMIIVPADTPGFRRVRNISCMGHAGDGWASHAELVFEDCRVPRENLLGERRGRIRDGPGPARPRANSALHALDRRLPPIARADVSPRAASRELAPGDPLGSRQTVQNWIAESRSAIDAARLLVLHAAWTIDSQGIAQAREAISLIKFHVAGVMQEVVDRAVQVHGALGISDDTVLSWFYRQERAARIYDGPDEVHKVVVAKRMLKEHERGQPMSFPIDQARPVREGEQLDVARLERLSRRLTCQAPAQPLSVEQFLHGHSNLTYLITVGTDEWVLRRPPFGNRVKTAHDMGREYRILSRLCHGLSARPAASALL